MTDKKPINFLSLYFPHGASVAECEIIAHGAQKIVGAGVSQGGFATTNKYGIYDDNVTFSEDTMSYEYGHKRESK